MNIITKVFPWVKRALTFKRVVSKIKSAQPCKPAVKEDDFIEVMNSMISKNASDLRYTNKFVTGSITYSPDVESTRDQACVSFITNGAASVSENALLLIKRELPVEKAEFLFGDDDILSGIGE